MLWMLYSLVVLLRRTWLDLNHSLHSYSLSETSQRKLFGIAHSISARSANKSFICHALLIDFDVTLVKKPTKEHGQVVASVRLDEGIAFKFDVHRALFTNFAVIKLAL